MSYVRQVTIVDGDRNLAHWEIDDDPTFPNPRVATQDEVVDVFGAAANVRFASVLDALADL